MACVETRVSPGEIRLGHCKLSYPFQRYNSYFGKYTDTRGRQGFHLKSKEKNFNFVVTEQFI